jgi:hypothetical protein
MWAQQPATAGVLDTFQTRVNQVESVLQDSCQAFRSSGYSLIRIEFCIIRFGSEIVASHSEIHNFRFFLVS